MNPITRTGNPTSHSLRDYETAVPGSLVVYPFEFNPQMEILRSENINYPSISSSQQLSHPPLSSTSSFSTFPLTSQAANHSASEIERLIHEMLAEHPPQRNLSHLCEESPLNMLGLLRESESSRKSENIEALALKVSSLRCSDSFLIYYEGAYLGCRKGDTVFNLCFRALSETGENIMQSLFTDIISNLSSYMQKAIAQNKKNAIHFKSCMEDTTMQFKKFPGRISKLKEEKKLFLDNRLSQGFASKTEDSPPAKKKARHDFPNRESQYPKQISEQTVPPRSFYIRNDLSPSSVKPQESIQEKFSPPKPFRNQFYGETNNHQPPKYAKRKYTQIQTQSTIPATFSPTSRLAESFLLYEHHGKRDNDQIFVDASFILTYLKKIENLNESDLSLETLKDIGRIRCSDSGTISYLGSKINIKNGDTLFSIIYREFKAFEDMKVWFNLFTKLNKIQSEMKDKAKIDNSNIFKQCDLDTLRMRKLS